MATVSAPLVSVPYTLGNLVTEGKTKKIFQCVETPGYVIIESKDDLTGGNGKLHDLIKGKGEWANGTTCNVFELLKKAGIPLAYQEKLGPKHFLARECKMIPLEVVARRQAHGSYCKRNPDVKKGTKFTELVYEWFYKTKDRLLDGQTIPCDDPLMQLKEDSVDLFLPDVPLDQQKPFLSKAEYPIKGNLQLQAEIESITKQVFTILEAAWDKLGVDLVDFKLEFGLDEDGNLYLADVVDNDSWRIVDRRTGEYLDKQRYRDQQDTLITISQLYQDVRDMTARFIF